MCTEGRLILEFTFDDLMRIKSWHMAVRQHRELVPRAIVSMSQDPSALEQLTKNITRQGITNSTLNYLRVSSAAFSYFEHVAGVTRPKLTGLSANYFGCAVKLISDDANWNSELGYASRPLLAAET